MALVPQMADAVSVPVIASGGIMDGRGIAAALALGAEVAQMGRPSSQQTSRASATPTRPCCRHRAPNNPA
ncbi:hypothetical protein G6F52_014079 [Rhizopus delemar]|nr:hypothetical protein G6F52_014079 [Rhizopus delemar]